MKNLSYIWLLAAAVLLAAGCSTTRRLADGEVLYTGVRKMEVEHAEGEKMPSAVESAVKSPLSVKPNNPLFSPYVRTPLPIGLWAYNAFYTERQTGVKAWIFRNFAKKPVLMSDVKPELRTSVVQDILDNHGYFGSTARYEIIPKKNPKKARVSYFVDVARPWYLGNVEYPPVKDSVTRVIDSLKAGSLIREGGRYDIDTLSDERVRITNYLRNNSYYYFRPDYIEYLADTTRQRYEVDLRMVMASGIPAAALQPYRIGDVNIQIYSSIGRGDADTSSYNDMKIWYQKPLRVRPKIFRRTLTFEPGQPAKVDEINSTLTNLTKLGIFRYVNMTVTPLDSLKAGDDKLDLTLTMAMDNPIDAELEVDFSYKSSSFIGPKAGFSIRNKNFLKGGEVFSVKLNGGYEWQTGNTSSQVNASTINSYEFGLNASLMLPRLVAPGFILKRDRNNYDNRTTYQIGADLLNRPKFFKMLSLNGSFSYDFQTSPVSFHNLTLFKLTYNRLLSTTAEFDETMRSNEAIRRSFENQLIPSLSYTYTLNRRVGRSGRDQIVWTSTAMSAGNLFAGLFKLFRAKGTYTIFGNPFSQFVKGTTELKYYKQLGKGDNMTLATRFMVGAGHAYGNWPYLPYTEQFTIGGANSIRAFTIRSLGPGSYRPPKDKAFGYFDQAGTFKLEANLEFRFRIVGDLHGAVFLDAGNIWLLENDPARPGGKLTGRDFFRDIATGTGAGLRYDLSFLVIRADLGIGIHTPYPNPDKKGYYNIPRFKDGLGFHLAIGYPF